MLYITGTKGVDIRNNKILGSQDAVLIENSGDIFVENNGMFPVNIKN